MGGRLPDPGPTAVCAACGERRGCHGGRRQLGACPGQQGLHAQRFRLQPQDKPARVRAGADAAPAAPPAPRCRICPGPAGTRGVECRCPCHTATERAGEFREMSRGDRRGNMCLDSVACDDGREHRWQPVSFVFESQLLDGSGRVVIRQPGLHEGRVYVVCMACRTHTYVITEWAGWFLGGPDYSALGMEDKAGNLPEKSEGEAA